MARSTRPKQVIVFADQKGKEPFTEWLYGLKDSMNRQRVMSLIRRLEHGNFGDCAPVGEGVREL